MTITTLDGNQTHGDSDAKAYYTDRWKRERRANIWAMNRASVILAEISMLGIKNPKMLDNGCGTGWLTEILVQFGETEGVDLAPEAARSFHPTLTFHDVEHMPAGPFDVVVSQEVLEHVHDQREYLAQTYRILRDGGYLVLTTPNASVSLCNPALLVQPTEKHLTRFELRQMLTTEGFLVKRLYSFFYGYAKLRPYWAQMRFGHLLNSGLHLMAVCRKS